MFEERKGEDMIDRNLEYWKLIKLTTVSVIPS
jgi:hypothetical protein